jgi:hypothetical protein
MLEARPPQGQLGADAASRCASRCDEWYSNSLNSHQFVTNGLNQMGFTLRTWGTGVHDL